METFTTARNFIDNPQFALKRHQSLKNLNLDAIDTPIVDIISNLSQLSYCYTLQCCWGHFIHEKQLKRHDVKPLSNYSEDTIVHYRLAYLALCIHPDEDGKRLYRDLRNLVQINPDYIQFGSADWFWQKHINSFAVQVEPDRFRTKDSVKIKITEALHIQEVREQMFKSIREIILHHKI